MSVGDYVERYTTEEAEMDEQWDELEAIIAKLDPPLFYVRGNHDINMPLTQTWVTMTEDGPQIAGIVLKGIFDRKGLDPGMFGAYDRSPGSGGGH